VKRKAVILRGIAAQDVDAAIDYYFAEGGDALALAFVDAVEAALTYVAAHPSSGSPRYGIELGLPELRSWPVKRFPHILFYVERDDEIDVWRVLHGKRDIPESLQADQ